MKTKPFDLKAALAGAKLVTRAGYEVVRFREAPSPGIWAKPYEAKIIFDDGSFLRTHFTAEGEHHNHTRTFSEYDLLLVDETEEITATVPDEPQVNLTMLYTRIDYLCQRVDNLERMLEEQSRTTQNISITGSFNWGRRKEDKQAVAKYNERVAEENFN